MGRALSDIVGKTDDEVFDVDIARRSIHTDVRVMAGNSIDE